jgi:hypothetical protein
MRKFKKGDAIEDRITGARGTFYGYRLDGVCLVDIETKREEDEIKSACPPIKENSYTQYTKERDESVRHITPVEPCRGHALAAEDKDYSPAEEEINNSEGIRHGNGMQYLKSGYTPTKEQAERVAKMNETEGNHYKLEIDPYEYCFKNNFNPLQFNAIKYLSRYNLKNGKQDLEKAINTINRLIELEYKK